MGPLVTLRIVRLTALVFVLVGMLWLVLARARPAQAAGEVIDCSSQNDLAAKINAGSGTITFNCNGNHDPATITIAQADGFYAAPGVFLTIDGGGVITLTGANTNRLFTVRPGTGLTLTNLTLTAGSANNSVDVPDEGGAILNEGDWLMVDNVTISQSFSNNRGGAIRAITGTATIVKNSLIDGNQSNYGGGIDSSGALTLSGVTVQNNLAIVYDGGGLNIVDTADISNSRIVSNTADAQGTAGGGGGINILSSGFVAIRGSQIDANQALTTAYSYGGAILNRGILSITQSAIDGNTAHNAGGIYNSGTLTLTNLSLSGDDTPGEGGGILNAGAATLSNVSLSNNLAGNGGGVSNQGAATLAAINVSFNANRAATHGGGMFNYGQATLAGVYFSDNSAQDGGGIYEGGGSPPLSLTDSILRGNKASLRGGGIDNNYGFPTLTHVSLSNNTSGSSGGGIYNYSGIVTLITTTLGGNSTNGNGGGIYNDTSGVANLSGSTLSDNTAGNGGGIYTFGGRARLTNVTLSGNSALIDGGGLKNYGGAAALLNVTLSNNSAPTGGALRMEAAASIYLTNTILAYSPAGGNCSGAVTASKFTFSSDNSCALAGTGDQNHVDPLLTALGNYGGPTQVHMLKLGSPAIDGVVGSDAPSVDQRGLPRPGPDGSYDIGAVERQPTDSDLAPRLEMPLIVR